MTSLLLFFVGAFVIGSQAVPPVHHVGLDIYYESRCPDCKAYFLDQLGPATKALQKYLSVNLVPYGKARTIRNGDQITFECQHGIPECILNEIHACALKRLDGDDLRRVELAVCLFGLNEEPMNAGEVCCKTFGLDWIDVLDCTQGKEGALLTDGYGNETVKAFGPKIGFVPTTAVNKDVGTDDYQNKLLFHLKDVLCDMLAVNKQWPDECV